MFDDSARRLNLFAESFFEELKLSENRGYISSLSVLHQKIPKEPILVPREYYQVISVGGSNLESAMVTLEDYIPKLTKVKKQKLARMDTKEAFFDQLLPFVANNIELLVLNFAYPMRPVQDSDFVDGILLRATKEHHFEGLIGRKIGISISEELHKRYGLQVPVWSINDVVSLCLSGAQRFEVDTNKIIGSIIGTGTNNGFFIDPFTIVNLESGNFNKFEMSESGKFIDSISTSPGQQRFEKEVSGAYLYQHFNYWADLMGLDVRLSSSTELNYLAKYQDSTASLCRQIIMHSARRYAALVKGIWLYKNREPLKICVEGSIFWKGFRYKDFVVKALEELEIIEHISFEAIDQSNLLGSAILPIYKE